MKSEWPPPLSEDGKNSLTHLTSMSTQGRGLGWRWKNFGCFRLIEERGKEGFRYREPHGGGRPILKKDFCRQRERKGGSTKKGLSGAGEKRDDEGSS